MKFIGIPRHGASCHFPVHSVLLSVLMLFLVFSAASAQIWESFTVWYDGNGANSGHISEENYPSGTNTITLKDNKTSGSDRAYVKDGCTFLGWSVYSEGDSVIAPIMPGGTEWEPVDVPVTYTEDAGGFVMFARWNCNVFTLSYDGNGAVSGSIQAQIVERNTAVVVKDNADSSNGDTALVRPGYTFTGWNTDAAGSGTALKSGDRVKLNRDHTLYAQWKPIPTATATKVPTATPTMTSTATNIPTATATTVPTDTPTAIPTATATAVPTDVPTTIPSATAMNVPTDVPTAVPSATATTVPTEVPTAVPSATATTVPTEAPTAVPATATTVPTEVPTAVPATATTVPTEVPTAVPATATTIPTEAPTAVPATATTIPTEAPTTVPATATTVPTEAPTAVPATATTVPTEAPTAIPSATATIAPTEVPTVPPVQAPTLALSIQTNESTVLNSAENPVADTAEPITQAAEENAVFGNSSNAASLTFTVIPESGTELPRTGLTGAMRSAKPASVKYGSTDMTLQIPSLNVMSSVVSVESADGSYPVEWLDADAGLLADTAMPGEGQSVIAAHNTLDAETYGPFALIASLENGDRFFLRNEENGLMIFEVYANGKIDAYDYAALSAQAREYDITVTLLTCEDELIDGGYASRRIVSARLIN